jgi:hypothetical protein
MTDVFSVAHKLPGGKPSTIFHPLLSSTNNPGLFSLIPVTDALKIVIVLG